MSTEIPVPFAGPGAGTADLTWGQLRIWSAMKLSGTTVNMGGVTPLPPGTTVEETVDLLRDLMSRHPTLRTKLTFADGSPQQTVFGDGVITLAVVDTDDPNTVRDQYQNTSFDSEREWPIRMAVIRDGDKLTYLVATYNQLALDQHGLDALMADLARRDTPVTALQPLDLARQQQTPAARRTSDLALRHWEKLLRTVPARRFGDSRDPRVPRYQETAYSSPAAHLAAQVVAARTGTDTSAVLLAAFATALADVTGVHPVLTQLLFSNRFRPGLADVVGHLTQTGLCVLDVAGVPFDEAVQRAGRATVAAGMNAYYDPRDRDELVAKLSAARGEPIDTSCYFNDRRTQGRQPPTQLPGAEEIRAALPEDAERFVAHVEHPTRKLFCHVNDVPDTLDVMIRADTHHIAPADVSACLRGMAGVIVTSALRPADPA